MAAEEKVLASPKAECEEKNALAAPEEGYLIQIDKRNTHNQLKVELSVVRAIDLGNLKCGGLKIKKIGRGGLFSKWNNAHPDKKVEVSDIIIEVNGTSGNTDLLFAEMGKEPVLNLRLVRPDDFTSP